MSAVLANALLEPQRVDIRGRVRHRQFMDAHLLGRYVALWHDRVTMETAHARAVAERLHLGDREEDGMPVIRHVRRVASMVPEEARAVAWLHEVLEWTAVTEQELLMAGLTGDELRALKLLSRTTDSHSDRRYLAHLDLIARATGDSGRLARIVKTADLKDRSLHPHVRRDGGGAAPSRDPQTRR